MLKITIGITGLLEILGRDQGIENPFWRSSYLCPFKAHVHYEKGKELTLFSRQVLNKLDYVTVYSFFKPDIISFYDPQYDMHLIRKRRFFKLVSTDPASCCFFGTPVVSHQFLSSSLNSKKNTKQLPYLNKELHCDLPTKIKPVHPRQEKLVCSDWSGTRPESSRPSSVPGFTNTQGLSTLRKRYYICFKYGRPSILFR